MCWYTFLLMVDDPNCFYNRSDVHEFGTHINAEAVLKLFKGWKERKSPGPDISDCLLKSCLTSSPFIYPKSLKLTRVPSIWKYSVIVPAPKIKHPKSVNDFHPCLSTSLPMKALEKIIKSWREFWIYSNVLIGQAEFVVVILLHFLPGHLDGAQTFWLFSDHDCQRGPSINEFTAWWKRLFLISTFLKLKKWLLMRLLLSLLH